MKIFLVGGFLGSGKTTAIQQACAILAEREMSCAVITNDQGVQLVDSQYIRSGNVPVREVVNGCFCCNYPALDEGIATFKEQSADVVFAESVGSCTDLIATVVNPLLKFRPDTQVVVSIFADARLLLNMLQRNELVFDNTVQYIYEKQLEEADILVMNKADLLDEKDIASLQFLLSSLYPRKLICFQDSYNPESVTAWLQEIMHFIPPASRKSLNIDYQIYGKGEARLAWLDEKIDVTTPHNNAPGKAVELAENIHKKITEQALPVGHLKFLVQDGDRHYKISFTQTTGMRSTQKQLRTQQAADISLLVNARVQTDPERLSRIVADAVQETLADSDCSFAVSNVASFQPVFPRPTHRIMS